MPQMKLSLDALKSLDLGVIDAMVSRHCQDIARDCIDRPTDKRPRRVTLEITMKPEAYSGPGGQTFCEEVEATFDVTARLPNTRSRAYRLGVKADGSVIIQTDDANDPDQLSIGDELESKRAKS